MVPTVAVSKLETILNNIVQLTSKNMDIKISQTFTRVQIFTLNVHLELGYCRGGSEIISIGIILFIFYILGLTSFN